MKRSRFGAILLAVLLVLGFGTHWWMRKCQTSVADDLHLAAQQALAENWEETDRLLRQAQNRWQHNYDFSAALVDHEPLEQADSSFAMLSVWQAVKEPAATAAGCLELEAQIRALIEEQKLSWRNLL